jgi:hypothetical protein
MPSLGNRAGWAFEEFARRCGDYAIAAVGAVIGVANGRVTDARIAIAGGGSGPMRATRAEQSLAGAMNGQMRPHPIAYCCGAKHARQKFWIEPCGDVELTQWLIQQPPAADTPRWKNDGNARMFFGFDRWAVEGRYNDPWPVMSNNLQFRRDAVRAVQKSFAVPLAHSILAGEPAPDATMVALIRFRFENLSDRPATAELPLAYSHAAGRIANRREARNLNSADKQTDTLLPRCERETLTIEGDRVLGDFKGERVSNDGFEFKGDILRAQTPEERETLRRARATNDTETIARIERERQERQTGEASGRIVVQCIRRPISRRI